MPTDNEERVSREDARLALDRLKSQAIMAHSTTLHITKRGATCRTSSLHYSTRETSWKANSSATMTQRNVSWTC